MNNLSSFFSKVAVLWSKNSPLKKPIVYIPVALVLLFIVYKVFFGSSTNGGTELLTITPSDFVQEVSVTGKVVPAQNVDMGFEVSGRVAEVKVAVGDSVKAGQTLAYLSNGDLSANVGQRQALLDAEQSRLAEIQRGSRVEDIRLAETDVLSAQNTFDQAKQTLVDQIKDSFSKADDTVRSKGDQMFTNPRSANPELIPFDNYALQQMINSQRLRSGEILTTWGIMAQKVTPDTLTDNDVTEARADVDYIRSFINNLSIAASSYSANTGISQSTIDKYKSDTSSARSSISLAASSLSSADQSYKTAKIALQRAKEQLDLKKAGSTDEQVQTQLATVKSANAQLQSARAALVKTLIVAPFDGVVTKADIKAGEIASPNTPVISVISASQYQMESYISENDISKVQVGQMAKVTLDAYGKENVFEAKVTEVDPAETVLEGVSTYKTKLQFMVNDPRIKSGMTANIGIETARRTGAIVVPQEAVKARSISERYVLLREGGKSVERTVKVGALDTNGAFEVTSGLNFGDVVEVPKVVTQ